MDAFFNFELIYFILRCPIVHKFESHFLVDLIFQCSDQVDKKWYYKSNSRLTVELLDNTLRNILKKF